MNARRPKRTVDCCAARIARRAVMLAAALVWAAVGQAAGSIIHPPASDNNGLFATNAPIPYFHITITGTNLSSLKKNPRQYVRAMVQVGDTVYTNVGVHLKGNKLGSFQPIDEKPSLTLNFDKFKHGQKFHGLGKIHLNNAAEDDSYLCEAICSGLFLAAGVPAPRVTHAVVEINGRDRGLYVLKEGVNKTFLRRHFKDPNGNLYDGGFVNDINEELEKDSGNGPDDRSDLDALLKAAQEPDLTNRWEQLDKVLDLDQFLSFLAMEVMTCHWDGYAMNRNNYRIYHDPTTDKLVFLPHGMDVMFTDPRSPLLPYLEGVVARNFLEIPEARSRYLERMSQLLTNVFKADALTAQARQLQARIRPVLAAGGPKAAEEHDEAVDLLRQEIRDRAIHIDWQLSQPEPIQITFDASGVAKLSGWRAYDPQGTASLNKTVDADGKETLHIAAGTEGEDCRASWRAQVLLERAKYRFEAMVRTAGVVAFKDPKGRGAGIRISGSEKPRRNKVVGKSRWKKVEYEFTVNSDTGNEIELVCELLARKGEAWFDVDSLKLVLTRD